MKRISVPSTVVAALVWGTAQVLAAAEPAHHPELLFEDGFNDLPPGMLVPDAIGAFAEYHYLRALAPKGGWAVACFKNDHALRAWRVVGAPGSRAMAQTYTAPAEERLFTHPILCAGDSAWRDYTVTVEFSPQQLNGASGLLFRYRNSRCWYFFGVDGHHAVLKRVRHESAFHRADEHVLAQEPFHWAPPARLRATVTVQSNRIRAVLNNTVELQAVDGSFPEGKIGLLADIPTVFHSVRVTTSRAELERVRARTDSEQSKSSTTVAGIPEMTLWKRLLTDGFGSGRSVRFGDLDGDGHIELLIGQPKHHGPKDRNTELGCLTAITLDGRVLWQIGEPDPWHDRLTSDLPFQIHDLDGDGTNEVVYCMNFELVIAEGPTGKTKLKIPTPETPTNNKPPYNWFARILGDAIYFCDLSGVGRPTDIILKDRYRYIWAFDARLKLLWHAECNTGHYPFACDIDNDGRDELLVGYTLFDHAGRKLWSLDGTLRDHADGVAIVRLGPEPDAPWRVFWAASDEGAVFGDIQGRILAHHRVGHVQNPVIAEFRPDLPGLETITINYWGNQGIVHVFDAEGRLIADFEPCHHGSIMHPVNWTGAPPEYFLLSASVVEGGLFDATGRRVVQFPNDGHPELCCAALDLTGDCRDEIVVWDPLEIWIYTQSDNPRSGKLYKPVRTPLYNASNYQVLISLPGWTEQ